MKSTIPSKRPKLQLLAPDVTLKDKEETVLKDMEEAEEKKE